jgi:ketosteroid isomerase-like protein
MRSLKIASVAATVLVIAGLVANSGVADVAAEKATPAPALEPVAVVDRFFRSLAAGDTSAASALLDPAVLVYESGSVERSRGEYAAHHLAADAAFLHSAKQQVISRRADTVGDLAWVATESRLKAYGAKSTGTISTETMILHRQPSGWRIVHIHWSSRSASR